ncbi:MAG: hypothetical protein ACPG5P_02475, partial [Saprospiraceae bacterium]
MKNIILSIFCLVFFLVSCDNMNLKKGENINDIIEISENPLEKPENQAENTREIYEISVQTEVRKSLPVSIKSLIPEDENLV